LTECEGQQHKTDKLQPLTKIVDAGAIDGRLHITVNRHAKEMLFSKRAPRYAVLQYYSSLGSFVAWAVYIRAERQMHLISSKSDTDCIPVLKVYGT
jgi:hypothetical protein